MSKPITVTICDSHPVARAGIRGELQKHEEDFRVLDEGNTAEDAVMLAITHKPDVVLMEVQFEAQADGLTALRDILKQWPEAKVMFVTRCDNPTYIARAIARGAKEYWLKSNLLAMLPIDVKLVSLGGVLSPNTPMYKVALKLRDKSVVDGLTARESQVLRHVCFGLSNAEIARCLGISIETVKEHIQNIFRKKGWYDRTAAAVMALKTKLVSIDI